jgi:hypothetical protein
MQLASVSHIDILRNDIYKIVSDRKNLMFYDGKVDGLEPNINCKFFYSSPFDPLEFVTIDVYEDVKTLNINSKKIKVFGIINIIRDKDNLNIGFYQSEYGTVLIEEVELRGVKKLNIKLYINEFGEVDINNTINYFEKKLCLKSIS